MIRRSGMAFAVSSLAVATVATSSASAQFVNGQVIQGRYYYPNVNTPYNDPLYDFTRTLVDGTDFTSGYDAGWRFDFVGNRFRIDFFLPSDANYFYFDLADGHTFNGYTLKDLNGTIPSFAGASVVASTQGNWSNVLTVASADMLVLDFRRLASTSSIKATSSSSRCSSCRHPAPSRCLRSAASACGAARGDRDGVGRFARSLHGSPTRAKWCGNQSACLTSPELKPILSSATGPLG